MDLYWRLREHFSATALILSIVALVLAVAGGAIAANSGGGKATASAGKRGPRGPKGPAGPAGAQGVPGTNGTNGKDGTNGTNGKDGSNGNDGSDGQSVTATHLDPGEGGCVEGGTELESAGSTEVICNGENGEKGEPWTAGGTLPPNATETGVWLVDNETQTVNVVMAPFNIPLAAPLDAAHTEVKGQGYVGTPGDNCPGKVTEPTAKSGFVCVYQRDEFNFLEGVQVVSPASLTAFAPTPGTARSGFVLRFTSPSKVTVGSGTWAVTG